MSGKELKIFALGILVASIGSVLIASNFSVTPSAIGVSENEGTASLTYHAKVCKTVTRTDGSTEDLGCSKNLFNTDGMNFTRDRISFLSNNATMNLVDVIAIANKTTATTNCAAAQAATDAILCGEYGAQCGLGRATADAVRLNGSAATSGNWSITREFTSTCASADINATGLFNSTTNASTGEVFFAQNTFSTATLNSGDKINVTWFIWVT